MSKRICVHCDEPVNHGEAVIRSESFTQVAYHESCWQLRLAARALHQINLVIAS